jgi:hypothetical protein
MGQSYRTAQSYERICYLTFVFVLLLGSSLSMGAHLHCWKQHLSVSIVWNIIRLRIPSARMIAGAGISDATYPFVLVMAPADRLKVELTTCRWELRWGIL